MPEEQLKQCTHHEALAQKMATKDALRCCQDKSRKRFWTIALSCIGTIVIGFVVGALQIGACADEDIVMKNAKQLATLVEMQKQQTKNIDNLIVKVDKTMRKIDDHVERDAEDHYKIGHDDDDD